jgi:hypothetical protein
MDRSRPCGSKLRSGVFGGVTTRVAPLRARLGRSQEQFAARYRIGLDVLQNWWRHWNEPDPIARNVLERIARDPLVAEQVLWGGGVNLTTGFLSRISIYGGRKWIFRLGPEPE